jgi:hypothetical protein
MVTASSGGAELAIQRAALARRAQEVALFGDLRLGPMQPLAVVLRAHGGRAVLVPATHPYSRPPAPPPGF